MERVRILSIGKLPDWACRALEPDATLEFAEDTSRTDILSRLDESVAVLIARGSARIDEEVLAAAPRLKAIVRTGVGYDTIDLEAAGARGIPVLYTPGAMSRAVAEHALALMLAAARNLRIWQQALQTRDWDARYRVLNVDLTGASVGIVGYGRIGSQVRQLLEPFDCRVRVADPYLKPEDYQQDGVEFCNLEQLISESEIVTLHVPLNQETRGLIDSLTLSRFRRGSILINTSRGAVVGSQDALYEALESGRLGAVGLDVFSEEPPDPSHPLLTHPRAILTGHVAARSRTAQRQILETVVAEVRAVLAGRPPRRENVVNPEVLKS